MIIQLPQKYNIDLIDQIVSDVKIEYDHTKVQQSRIDFLNFMSETKEKIFGFNYTIGDQQIKDLSKYESIDLERLLYVKSDQMLDSTITRITLFILINNLVNDSGISDEVIQELVNYFNTKQHINLLAVNYNSQHYDGSVNYSLIKQLKNLQKYDRIIITLTKSFSFATLLYFTYQSMRCIKYVIISTGISFEATNGVVCAFTDLVNVVKQHEGQHEIAKQLFDLVTDNEETSTLNQSLKIKTHNILQDAYSTRCIPQVVGASLDQIKHIIKQIDSQEIGQRAYKFIYNDGRLSEILYTQDHNNESEILLIDFLAIALSEIGAIAERRIQRMINPELTKLQGYFSLFLSDETFIYGHQILVNRAINLIQKNKKYCHAVSADSMPQTTFIEDINNNFEESYSKMKHITENTEQILSIEIFLSVLILEKLKTAQQLQMTQTLEKYYTVLSQFDSESQVLEWMQKI